MTASPTIRLSRLFPQSNHNQVAVHEGKGDLHTLWGCWIQGMSWP